MRFLDLLMEQLETLQFVQRSVMNKLKKPLPYDVYESYWSKAVSLATEIRLTIEAINNIKEDK